MGGRRRHLVVDALDGMSWAADRRSGSLLDAVTLVEWMVAEDRAAEPEETLKGRRDALTLQARAIVDIIQRASRHQRSTGHLDPRLSIRIPRKLGSVAFLIRCMCPVYSGELEDDNPDFVRSAHLPSHHLVVEMVFLDPIVTKFRVQVLPLGS